MMKLGRDSDSANSNFVRYDLVGLEIFEWIKRDRGDTRGSYGITSQTAICYYYGSLNG